MASGRVRDAWLRLAEELCSRQCRSDEDLRQRFASWLMWCERFSNSELTGIDELWDLVNLVGHPRYDVPPAEWCRVGVRMKTIAADSVDSSLMFMRSLLWDALGVKAPAETGAESGLDDTVYYAGVKASGEVFYFGPAYGESWDLRGRSIEEPSGPVVPASRNMVDAVVGS